MPHKSVNLFVFSSFLAFAACSSSSSSQPATVTDSGSSDTAVVDVGPTNVIDRGFAIDYGSSKPLKDFTVSEVGLTTKTDDTGHYQLTIPKDTPTSLMVTGPDYAKVILGEQSFSADYDRQQIQLPNLTLLHVGQGSLDGFDATKGWVNILVQPTGSCKDVAGGTLTVNAPAGAKSAYFKDKLPDTTVTSFISTPDRLPVAVVYNVPVGAALDLKIDHPTCKQKPFPATVDGVTYSGKVVVEPGDALSVAFYWLE